MERVKREIFQSQAFDLVKAQVGGPAKFLQYIDEKIEPVDGDIVSFPMLNKDSLTPALFSTTKRRPRFAAKSK